MEALVKLIIVAHGLVAAAWRLWRTGQESAHLGTGASHLFFLLIYFMADWLTICGPAPTRNWHDLPMAHEAEKDPAFFRLNSGKLGRDWASSMRGARHQGGSKSGGKSLSFLFYTNSLNRLRVLPISWLCGASMMQGHALQLKRQHSATSTDEDKNKENSTPVQAGQVVADFLPSTYACGYDGGAHGTPKGSPEWLLEEHICTSENNRLAMEVHECTMSALLAASMKVCWLDKFGSMSITGNNLHPCRLTQTFCGRHGCWRCSSETPEEHKCSVEDSIVYGSLFNCKPTSNKNKIKLKCIVMIT